MGTLDLALNKLEKIITHDSTIENVKKKKKKLTHYLLKCRLTNGSVKITLQTNKRLLCMSSLAEIVVRNGFLSRASFPCFLPVLPSVGLKDRDKNSFLPIVLEDRDNNVILS